MASARHLGGHGRLFVTAGLVGAVIVRRQPVLGRLRQRLQVTECIGWSAGDRLPAGAVTMSPWADLTLTSDAMTARAEADPICSREKLDADAAWYVGDTDRAHPLVSPLFADLSGLPPLLILVGTAEVLLDDATSLAERARDAGVEVELHVEDDLLHVWPMFPGVPEADAAMATMGDWIAAH